MATRDEIEKLLQEQEILRDAVSHPGYRILAQRLKIVARQSLKKQLDCDPYTEADEIQRNKQLRYVLNIMLPKIIEDLVNYDPTAPDKKVSPKKRWSIFEWFRW